ncbi:hypothetical protein E1B28_002172 [Marasmius oreades]|uniref:Extracellular metalloproteinase n=1 Tax=Marasmius oreades TaxID=181124 RepID=A0A9P7UL07_9AGAR|nr:uncharacterized protein E1B28_002172 [Marasmius oreades]KAG7086208.1 hypothetical protein E1B28_002172 [Marasmius oreades]
MVSFKVATSYALFSVLYTSHANAISWATTSKHATHRSILIGRDLKVEAFHPPSNYKTFGTGLELPMALHADSIKDQSIKSVSSQLKIDPSELVFTSGYGNDIGRVGYVKQMHEGVPFVNAVANVAFKDNKLVAFGQSFVDTNNIAPSAPSVDIENVIPKIEASLQGKRNEIKPTLEYLALQDGRVALVYSFQVQNEETGTWYEAYVDAHSGDLLSVTDFVAEATYKVLPVWKETIVEGLETLVDPQNLASSPQGWHGSGAVETAGNNVVAYKSQQAATTPQWKFQSTYNASQTSSTPNNLDAARTNAFYIINTFHDVLYQYGFTEAAFNFQKDNFGKGGAGNDGVLMSVQDNSGTNNANFATPPDGQSGRCRMYIWTRTSPNRDGTMQNDVPLHEMTHGLTNRMSGGGSARCLQTRESAGMGEGWSDAVADWFAHSNSSLITDFVMGQWVINSSAGIRSYPYSISNTINPLRYSSIGQLIEVHEIGEVRKPF